MRLEDAVKILKEYFVEWWAKNAPEVGEDYSTLDSEFVRSFLAAHPECERFRAKIGPRRFLEQIAEEMIEDRMESRRAMVSLSRR